MRTALAFLQTGADALTSVVAPLESVASPRPGSPAFFAPDFSITADRNWWFDVPEDSVRLVSRLEMAREFARDAGSWSGRTPDWSSPDEARFSDGFRSLAAHLAGGRLRKGVPVTLMRAELRSEDAWPLFSHAIGRLPTLPASLYAYGFYRPGTADGESPEFMVGATPEILFDIEAGRHLSTMAVAGTRRIGVRPGRLEASQKDVDEHQSVVDDLLAQLSSWGEPTASPLEARAFGELEHLAVDIRMSAREPLDFESVARRLHPTPALGVYPRGWIGQAWLEGLDPRGERHRFGAPFGLRWPSGAGRAVVAIRNLQYHDGQLEIWAGCGVVAQSRYEDEWQEVLDKMQAVRALWAV
jgi:menaquinone-specific isochorismate synthase